jgi:endonuclease III
LFRTVKKPRDFDRLSVPQLEKLIFPIGFYHTKARHLKQLPGALNALFDGRIPDRIEDLVQLPGVGRKVANLVRAVAFDKPAICVDVHVHRICNRLGLLKTRDPFETEMTLRKILSVRYWITWNSYLVSFGQTVCAPVGPRCSLCPLTRYCDRRGVTRHR